ncbi:hypothetical protein STSP2_01669 [Anaerohalosphaera lusitana]|uniref:Immunoglobulin I-set domain protein n=1 Tax=Anaerohalosphaera lusitana TaxID=1936003 RepID=A0A1U9NL94_9BACT|nr:LamG-like jellyroll fold domain-containing protein [Anaerohalosphaera lusitana]AQT68504.1 hypothetical protein STSP2_01669 [Anaerohalosphaera lusitana]
MGKKILPVIIIMVLAVSSFSHADLVAYWSLDDGSGSTAVDDSGNGADGVLAGPTWSTSGIRGGALQFDGVDDEVEVPANGSMGGEIDFTVSAWIKTSAAKEQAIVFQRDESGWTRQYQLNMTDTGAVRFYQYDYWAGADDSITTTATFNDGQWHSVVGVAQGETMTIYVDGVEEATGARTAGKMLDSSIKVSLGRDIRDDNKAFEGMIDEVVILSEAATADMLAALSGDAALPFLPASGKDQMPATVTLEWAAPINVSANGYDVYVGTDAGSLASVVSNTQAQSYELSGLALGQGYVWRVDAVTSAGTVTGPTASFTTRPAEPVITTQPTSNLVAEGETAEFSVEALYATSYQWYKDGVAISGETASTLTVAGATLADEGAYTCEMTSDESTTIVTTDPVKLVIEKMVAYYPFENSLADATTLGNDATYTGAAASYVAGIDGQAVQLTVDPEHIILPSTVLDEFGTEFAKPYTVSFWARTDAVAQPTYTGLFYSNSDGWDFQIDFDGSGNYGYNTGTIVAGPASTDWVLVTAVCDGSGTTMYYNGVAANSGGNVDTDLGEFGIGANRAGDLFFEGEIDDFRMYNYALGAVDVATLYTDITGTSVCTEEIQMDFNGDCIVDMADLMEIMSTWMDCNIVPDCTN